MEEIIRRFDEIERRLKLMQYDIEKCRISSENMDRHISFIESFWRHTLGKVFTKTPTGERHAFEDIV